jgi:ATP phosphoribosyltransferase
VLFQRAADIIGKVEEGGVDFGITGYDIVCEHASGSDDVIVMYKDLRYGRCDLVVAVPERWLDVSSVGDLAEVAVFMKENRGRSLRIATKYTNLTRQWLYEREIIHFNLVGAQGAIEAAPNMGDADMIVDVTSSGTTLRENRLKMIEGGTILNSQACLIGNRRLLRADPARLNVARMIIELIEANLKAKKFLTVTANISGQSPDAVAASLSGKGDLTGLHGPTISKVYSTRAPGSPADDYGWYAVTIVIEERMLMQAIDHLREFGGKDITVSPPKYVFDSHASNYESLVRALHAEQDE